MKILLRFFGDEAMKATMDQVSACRPQELGSGKVHLLNDPFASEGQIADRRKIIEFGVSPLGFLQRSLAPLELLVLDLQFCLIDVHLMEQLEEITFSCFVDRPRLAQRLFRSSAEEL
jgi:hypothetical protein